MKKEPFLLSQALSEFEASCVISLNTNNTIERLRLTENILRKIIKYIEHKLQIETEKKNRTEVQITKHENIADLSICEFGEESHL